MSAPECEPMTPMKWTLGRCFSEPDGTPSSRRILFAMAVVFALGLATGAFYAKQSLTPEIVDLIKTVLYATAAAMGLGKFAEGAKP